MLSFFNGQSSEAYKVAMNLEEKLCYTGYEFNPYQILGLSTSFDMEELNRNYNILNKLIEQNNGSFSKEEVDLITNSYRSFTSFLGATWNERKMNSHMVNNVKQQSEAMAHNEEMFKGLKENINQKITVSYIENKDGEFVENKVIGILNQCNPFENIVIGCEANFDIDFLGEQTAIIEICDSKGKQIYTNKYLLNEDKRKLYDGSIDTVNGFRIASWSFYKARILDATQNTKNLSYAKKR